jgi:hypothetical protein
MKLICVWDFVGQQGEWGEEGVVGMANHELVF